MGVLGCGSGVQGGTTMWSYIYLDMPCLSLLKTSKVHLNCK